MDDPLQSFWALVNHRLCLNNGYTDRSAKATKADKKFNQPRWATAVGMILLFLYKFTCIHQCLPQSIHPAFMYKSGRHISLCSLPIGFVQASSSNEQLIKEDPWLRSPWGPTCDCGFRYRVKSLCSFQTSIHKIIETSECLWGESLIHSQLQLAPNNF